MELPYIPVKEREDLLSRLQFLSELLDNPVDVSNKVVRTEPSISVEDELMEDYFEDCMLVEIEFDNTSKYILYSKNA